MLNKFSQLVLIVIILPLIVFTCRKDEVNSRSYPRVRTIGVSEIDAKGILVSATIYTSGKEEVIEYGFAWSKSEYIKLTDNHKVIGNQQPVGVFTARINSGFEPGMDYYICAYARTKSQTVYGNGHKFKSQGSEPPVVYGIEPVIAGWGDTITVKGQGFSSNNFNNVVKIGDAYCDVVKSTDTTLTIKISPDISQLESNLSVAFGVLIATTKPVFKLLPPIITSFTPKEGVGGTTLTISGQNFHPDQSKNFVMFDTYKAQIAYCSKSKIVVSVPNYLPNRQVTINIKSGGLSSTAAGLFGYKFYKIYSIKPESGTFGDTIAVTVNAVDLSDVNLSFNNAPAEIVSIIDSTLRVKVPNALIYNSSIIYMTLYERTVTSPKPFILFSPIIENVTPLEGNFETIIRIRGRNFNPIVGNNTVLINDMKGELLPESTQSELVTKLPSELVSTLHGKVSIKVIVGHQFFTYPTSFSFLPPVIKDFNPKFGVTGSTVTITGANFYDKEFSLYLGSTLCKVISISQDQIIADIPSLNVGTYRFMVNVMGQSAFSPVNFTNKNPWVVYSNFPGNTKYDSFYFTLNGKIYIGGGYEAWENIQKKDFWEFNPITKIWTQKADFIGDNQRIMADFSLGGYGYVGHGRFWRYDPATNTWKEIATAIDKKLYYSTHFVIGDKAYFGLGIYNTGNQMDPKWVENHNFYEYNQQNDIWITKKSQGLSTNCYTSFSANGKGYYFDNGRKQNDSNICWEYDPINDTWTKKGESVIDTFNDHVLVLNDKVYIGSNDLDNDFKNAIYNFDLTTYKWIKIVNTPYPINETRTPCFAVNNKGYILAIESFVQSLYEFDPSKIQQ